jgi:hypothetical protein
MTQPLDEKAIAILVTSAHKFEKAVGNREAFSATITAARLLQDVKRFLPSAFSSAYAATDASSSRDSGSAAFRLNPDPAYVNTVRTAVAEFKKSVLLGNVTQALDALRPTGTLTGPSPKEELQRLELDAARVSGTQRLLFLPRMAKRALWAGDVGRAEQCASEILRLTLRPGRVPFDMEEAIQDGNLVLGLVALRHGDKERAKQHLLASVRTEGSFEMKMVGPNRSLAHELLKAGERETVLEYLDGCKFFWRGERGELENWKARIRNGEDPEFDGLYFSA